MTDERTTSPSTSGDIAPHRVRRNAGDLDAPVFEWVGGKNGYVWVGNEMDRAKSQRPGRCVMTLTRGEAKRLRDWLDAALNGGGKTDA